MSSGSSLAASIAAYFVDADDEAEMIELRERLSQLEDVRERLDRIETNQQRIEQLLREQRTESDQ